MARKLRIEVEGGLYHVITRGNDRQDIFHSRDDHLKFLSLLANQKARLPFYLYAYCLMTNHIHLLIERQGETVGKIMQRVLTGYSQYYNRRYKHVGHVFQGRHKSILCQSDSYLSQLVRYIHLNPIRAKMVGLAEDYPFSSQRAYLGLEAAGIVDVDPVLRHFGPVKEIARERFRDFVAASVGLEYPEDFDSPAERDILGSEEFIDSTIHRIGAVARRNGRRAKKEEPPFNAESLIASVEAVFGLSRDKFCGQGKTAQAVMAKEVLILTGKEAGASLADLSSIIDLDTSTVSRRNDAARQKADTNSKLGFAKDRVAKEYRVRIARLQD